MPGDDSLGEDVEDERDVDKAQPGPHISEVGNPDPVRRWGGEVAVEQVIGPAAVLGRDGGADLLAAAHPLDAENAHTPIDGAGSDIRESAAAKIRSHLPPAIQALWGEPTPTVRVGGEPGVEDGVDYRRVADRPGCWLPRRPPGPIGARGDLAALLTQYSADRLDRIALSLQGVDESHDQRFRGSSSPAKKVVAARRISTSSRSRRFSALSRLISANSSLVTPSRSPASTCAWRHHPRKVSLLIPSRRPTASHDLVTEPDSTLCSVTSRTARALTSAS